MGVIFLAFLAGLALGLGILGIQQFRINQRLRQILSTFGDGSLPTYFSTTSRLNWAITQQQKTQQRLQELLRSVEYLIDQAPIAYLQVDRDSHLLWCNSAATQLLNVQQPRGGGRRLLLEAVRSYELDQLIEETRSQQTPCDREWLWHPVNADPQNPTPQQPIPLTGYALPLPDGQIGVFLENRLEVVTLAQQRDRWVSDVAHELKTPLTSIRLVAEMVSDRIEDELKPWMERLLGEVLHLSNLVHDLLDLSRLEQHSLQTLEITDVDLSKVIQAAWQNLEPLAKTKQLTLVYQGPSSLMIDGDQSRLYRVFLNLFDNAVKYSPLHGTLTIALAVSPTRAPDLPPSDRMESGLAGPVPDSIQIDVIDEGPGFAAHDLPYVFDRFYRADPSRSKLSLGSHLPANTPLGFGITLSSTGLGLAIVRQIILAHNGRVQAQNHPDTRGAWIQLHMPVHQLRRKAALSRSRGDYRE